MTIRIGAAVVAVSLVLAPGSVMAQAGTPTGAPGGSAAAGGTGADPIGFTCQDLNQAAQDQQAPMVYFVAGYRAASETIAADEIARTDSQTADSGGIGAASNAATAGGGAVPGTAGATDGTTASTGDQLFSSVDVEKVLTLCRENGSSSLNEALGKALEDR